MSVKIVAGGSHQLLGHSVARELGASLTRPQIAEYADGETRVYIEEEVQDAVVFIVQSTCTPVNENLLGLSLLADAAHAAGAARIIAVAPYFGYARQDQRSRRGEPRSAQLAGRLLAMAGVDHLVTLDLHSPALESALPMPATLLQAENVFLGRIKAWNIGDLVVVSPDAGGIKRAQRYAAKLATPVAVVVKERPRPDVAEPRQVLGDVRGRSCLIVDDMASTGQTLAGAAEALRKSGASEIYGVFTHAVMALGAEDRLAAVGFNKLMTSDSVPVQPKTWLEVAPLAPILAASIRRLCNLDEGSVWASEEQEHQAFPESGAVFM
jgi:ribose-phosphate pyrophosphokinase